MEHLTRLLGGMEGLGDDQTQQIAEDLVNALGNMPQVFPVALTSWRYRLSSSGPVER